MCAVRHTSSPVDTERTIPAISKPAGAVNSTVPSTSKVVNSVKTVHNDNNLPASKSKFSYTLPKLEPIGHEIIKSV